MRGTKIQNSNYVSREQRYEIIAKAAMRVASERTSQRESSLGDWGANETRVSLAQIVHLQS